MTTPFFCIQVLTRVQSSDSFVIVDHKLKMNSLAFCQFVFLFSYKWGNFFRSRTNLFGSSRFCRPANFTFLIL